jgi:hypothetical protein
MAHFAKLDENNIVRDIVVVHNNVLLDENGIEQEEIGIAFCKSLYGENTNWKQTSYNNNFRGTFAGMGYKYDSLKDMFIPEQPFPSWVFNEETCKWEAPVSRPDNESDCMWNEETLSWILL